MSLLQENILTLRQIMVPLRYYIYIHILYIYNVFGEILVINIRIIYVDFFIDVIDCDGSCRG